MRLVGPNCFGIINTAKDVSLNATFAPVAPVPGRVAFASQSGGLGIAVLEEACRHGIGLSSFVSVGNKADVSGNDLIQYWEQDPGTDVILLYLESFGNPHRFAKIARQVSRTKPIIALKAGRTRSGRRAATSHTAALASPDVAVDALFAQTGVIRVDTLAELFDTAELLAAQPIPAGRRVAIVGNAGGPGILAADACEAAGLEVVELSERTQTELRSFLPAAASVANPVDMVASASAEDYQRVIQRVLGDDTVDAVLAIFVPPLVTDPDAVALAIATAARGSTKPIMANFLGMAAAPISLAALERAVPNFAFPEPAVRALARAHQYGEWLRRPCGQTAGFDDIDVQSAREIVRSELSRHPQGCWLGAGEGVRLLRTYGISVADTVVVHDVNEALKAAERIRYPVALEGCRPRIGAQDRGGRRTAFADIGLGTERGIRRDETQHRGQDERGGSPGDDQRGRRDHCRRRQRPVIRAAGHVWHRGDRSRAVRGPSIPHSTDDRRRRGRTGQVTPRSPLLFGFRGSPPVNVAALEDMLLRVARLVEDLPDIAEMDLNPVIVGPEHVQAVDVKIRIAPSAPGPDPNLRRLR